MRALVYPLRGGRGTEISWGRLGVCSHHGAKTETCLTESPQRRMLSLPGLQGPGGTAAAAVLLVVEMPQCLQTPLLWKGLKLLLGYLLQLTKHDRELGEDTCAITSVQIVFPLLWPTWALCILSTHSTNHSHTWASSVAPQAF